MLCPLIGLGLIDNQCGVLINTVKILMWQMELELVW